MVNLELCGNRLAGASWAARQALPARDFVVDSTVLTGNFGEQRRQAIGQRS